MSAVTSWEPLARISSEMHCNMEGEDGRDYGELFPAAILKSCLIMIGHLRKLQFYLPECGISCRGNLSCQSVASRGLDLGVTLTPEPYIPAGWVMFKRIWPCFNTSGGLSSFRFKALYQKSTCRSANTIFSVQYIFQ